MRTFLPAILVVLTLSGCVMGGRNITQEQIDQIDKGNTTKTELISMLGKPQSKTHKSSGYEVLTWSYFNSGLLGKKEQAKVLTVILAPDDTVKNFSFKSQN
ncbi:SmpA/OmlA family protein [Pseudomonas duriflava]|uniref:SmpA/OmlA family protein n=1 Tax=Pseudomonas duriflava TaxID=459528 RepID=A0A562Q7T7_9PSED|nr:outer membrane protein assembly factor BamE [Pseudomonas duriflava]TWI52778.1 SmpA/OmlA family protein [Pseudomonas duriflava]